MLVSNLINTCTNKAVKAKLIKLVAERQHLRVNANDSENIKGQYVLSYGGYTVTRIATSFDFDDMKIVNDYLCIELKKKGLSTSRGNRYNLMITEPDLYKGLNVDVELYEHVKEFHRLAASLPY